MMLAVIAALTVGAAGFFGALSILAPAERRRTTAAARLTSIADHESVFEPGFEALGRRLGPSNLDRQLVRFPLGSMIKRDLQRSGLAWQVRDYIGVMLVLAVVGGSVAFLFSATAFPLGGLAGALVPVLIVKRIASKRASRLNGQVVDLVELLASSLRSGFSFVQSLELALREQPEPMAGELRQVMRETSLGMSTDEALQRLADRTGDEDLGLVLTAVLIQRRVGGNLAEVLGGIVEMIRDRARVRGEIHTLTAQARMSSWIVGSLPVVLAIVMSMMQKGYMAALYTEPVGRLMLIAAVVLEVIGLYLVRRIAFVDY
ncbi:MAG: type II secretion system F family protein [Dehalococcoidia bacterium]